MNDIEINLLINQFIEKAINNLKGTLSKSEFTKVNEKLNELKKISENK